MESETMRVNGLVVLATMVALGAVPARAQGTITGKWTTEYPTGIRNENGEIAVASSRPATMTLTLKGDSVLGSWQLSAPAGGAAPPALHMMGKRTGTKYVLQDDPIERTVNMGDGPKQVKMFTRWEFEVKGDVLEGVQHNLSPDGSFEGPELPFNAKRVKG